jgi:hypothetical protein
MFNPYEYDPNGPYGSSGQPARQPAPQYLQHGASQTHRNVPQPPLSYPGAPVILIPQRSPEYLSQFEDFSNRYHPPVQPQPYIQDNRYYPQRRTPQNGHMASRPVQNARAAATQPAPPPPPMPLPVDLQLLLLSLADEYITAARNLGPLIALNKQENKLKEYYELMATGMGCMDTVLRVLVLMRRLTHSSTNTLGRSID